VRQRLDQLEAVATLLLNPELHKPAFTVARRRHSSTI
jgi:hypothetical protein